MLLFKPVARCPSSSNPSKIVRRLVACHRRWASAASCSCSRPLSRSASPKRGPLPAVYPAIDHVFFARAQVLVYYRLVFDTHTCLCYFLIQMTDISVSRSIVWTLRSLLRCNGFCSGCGISLMAQIIITSYMRWFHVVWLCAEAPPCIRLAS